MNESQALELLRSADPARDVEVRWAEPPPVAEVARSPRRALLAVAAVVVLVAALAGSVALLRHGSGEDGPSIATTSLPPDYIRRGQPDPHQAQTSALAHRVYATLPALPGSIRRPSAPYPALRQLQVTSVVGRNVIDHVAWWVWSGTHEQAVREYQQRLPKDLPRQSGSGPIYGVRVFPFEHAATAATAQLVVSVSVLDLPHGVAIRVDVQAIWRPSRKIDSFIASVRSVDVRYDVRGRQSHSVAERSFGNGTARELAIRVNGLYTATSFSHGCGAPGSRLVVVTLTFRTRAGRFTATSGCGILGLTSPSMAYVNLDSGNIDERVRTLLGLPADFGR